MIKRFLLSTLILVVVCELAAQQYGSFKDSRDGKVYKTVKIGDQVWMAENLNTDRFRNGDIIPEAKSNEDWRDAVQNMKPAWCYYNNDIANGAKYGKLYNWYAVNDSRGLAPTGWHIPTDSEWINIEKKLSADAGKKMKSTSEWISYTSGGSKNCHNCASWNSEYRSKVPCHICKDTRTVPAPKVRHSGNGSNLSGFSGLPGGYRESKSYGYFSELFDDIGRSGYWWSSSDYSKETAIIRNLFYINGDLHDFRRDKGEGFSVRCIKD
jgi:uncharacterized protein (TIGR02145 family)